MSDLSKALLIDIGNSLIKFALVNTKGDLDEIRRCNHPEDLRPFLQYAEQVIIASVGHASLVKDIARLCEQSNKACRLVHTEAETLGIHCAYEKFETLGVDRWLAILAAREITALPVAVIDLGTANTCDIVVNNTHLGGWIGPGFSVMRTSLLKSTQRVFADEKIPVNLALGSATEDCVNLGCLASQSGFVMMAEEYLSSRYEDYLIIITGGGQNTLSLKKNNKIFFSPNLVLRGLGRLI